MIERNITPIQHRQRPVREVEKKQTQERIVQDTGRERRRNQKESRIVSQYHTY